MAKLERPSEDQIKALCEIVSKFGATPAIAAPIAGIPRNIWFQMEYRYRNDDEPEGWLVDIMTRIDTAGATMEKNLLGIIMHNALNAKENPRLSLTASMWLLEHSPLTAKRYGVTRNDTINGSIEYFKPPDAPKIKDIDYPIGQAINILRDLTKSKEGK